MNAADYQGVTPLAWAVVAERPDMVKLLLDGGAIINSGRVEVSKVAEMNKNKEITEILKEHQAQAEQRHGIWYFIRKIRNIF